jgi:hypothetical protein
MIFLLVLQTIVNLRKQFTEESYLVRVFKKPLQINTYNALLTNYVLLTLNIHVISYCFLLTKLFKMFTRTILRIECSGERVVMKS